MTRVGSDGDIVGVAGRRKTCPKQVRICWEEPQAARKQVRGVGKLVVHGLNSGYLSLLNQEAM